MNLSPALEALAARDLETATSELSMLLVMGDAADPSRALPLHLLALIELDRGQPDAVRALLQEAADVERRAGCEGIALHTAHQLALGTQADATIGHVAHYYQETYGTLSRMRQSEGMAMCLKSMAEICLLRGRRSEAEPMLRRSAQLLAGISAPATEHVHSWIRLLGG